MLQQIADFLTYGVLRLPEGAKLTDSVNFFIYDSIKILLLLFIMITVIGFFRTFIPAGKVRKWLTGRGLFLEYIAAAAFGAVTPFCSCSSIPIFLSFIKAGVPLGPSFSFLVTSPLINEYLVVLMLGFFGLKITVVYVASGMLIGIISGIVISSLRLERNLERDFRDVDDDEAHDENYKDLFSRMKFGLNEGLSMTSSIWMWVLLGVAVGALIHNYVPEGLIHRAVSAGGIFTVPLATFIGVPMYGSCAAIVPVAVVLFNKGVPLGTALAFMMAVSALSLPEAVILRRAMNLKLIGIFFGIVSLAIIFTGYLINFAQGFITR